MATVIQLTACTGGSIINVLDRYDDYSTGDIGYFNFTGATESGCYEVVAMSGGSSSDTILAGNVGFTDCDECQNNILWTISSCIDELITFNTAFEGRRLYYTQLFSVLSLAALLLIDAAAANP